MSEPASLFIGRYSPFHEGHKALIDKILGEGKNVVIAIRDTPISQEDPYTVEEREQMINKIYQKEITEGKVTIWAIPDINEVCYGRKVGWGIREVRLDKTIEKVSATKIREREPKHIIWLTGNSGAGKTTLARLLQKAIGGVILDGDDMRRSISTDKGFSKEDREEHNYRVARLAGILFSQNFNVIIPVIAPFQNVRENIEQIIKPIWVYVKRALPFNDDRPYEVPRKPHIIVDNGKGTAKENLDIIFKYLRSQ